MTEHTIPRIRRVARALGVLALAAAMPAAIVVGGSDPLSSIVSLSFGAVGIALVARRPGERIGWLLILLAVGFVPVGATLLGSANGVVADHASVRITTQAWLNNWGFSLLYGTLAGIAAVFPSGHFPTGRIGLAARLAVTVPLILVVLDALAPEMTVGFADGTSLTLSNPFGIAPQWTGWTVIGGVRFAAILGSLGVAVGTSVVRFRRARGVERQQLKWLVAALASVPAAFTFAAVAILLVDPTGSWMWLPSVVAYLSIPVSIWIAISRFRLYEIDRIVSRTIGWAVSTGAILAMFALLMIGLQAVLAPVTNESTLAVAASTLAAFALFQPLRHRVQSAVDHRFNRSRYDAGRIAARLAARLRDETDLPAIRAGIVESARATVQPASVGLWVRKPA